jgi:molecular chaperone DnaK
LESLLGKTLNETVNPDEVVGMGAAVQAGIIAGEITDLILLDVTPLSLGVETMGGLMTTIINRNASIPVKQGETFSTGSDFQANVEIHVLQGERSFSKDNKSLGIFRLTGIPSAPKGVPKINVSFQLDINGLLAVSAREEETGQEQSIKIEGASVLSREEVSKMVKESEEFAQVDKSKKSLVNLTYELDALFTKGDVLMQKNLLGKRASGLYVQELLKQIKMLYKERKLTTLSNKTLQNLKYAKNLVKADFYTKLFQKEDGSSRKPNKGSDQEPYSHVIDVD